MDRDSEWIDQMGEKYRPPNHCCPSCACPGYDKRVDALERRGAWLVILLRKDHKHDAATRIEEGIKWSYLDRFTPIVRDAYGMDDPEQVRVIDAIVAAFNRSFGGKP